MQIYETVLTFFRKFTAVCTQSSGFYGIRGRYWPGTG